MKLGCLHKGIFDLFKITGDYYMEIATAETRALPFPVNKQIRIKIVVNGKSIEQSAHLST
jgi:hypothetical protein